ncbi:hypothetical protein IJT10_05020, partial [bacterium]|nr:hypothetical protein [bacterium]
KELGIEVVVDQFGTNSLPFSTLLNMPIWALKSSYQENNLRYYQLIRHISQFLQVKHIINGVNDANLSAELVKEGSSLQEGFVFTQPMSTEGWQALAERGYKL